MIKDGSVHMVFNGPVLVGNMYVQLVALHYSTYYE